VSSTQHLQDRLGSVQRLDLDFSSTHNVYVLAPVGVAAFVGALATFRGVLVVAT
jgi:hypothetical protein